MNIRCAALIIQGTELDRPAHLAQVEGLLRRYPVVAILGARQVGKTTLARAVIARRRGPSTRFDLEDPADLGRLAEPMLALKELRGLVVLDEVQRRPEIFAVLRVLADRHPAPARFLVLGSASRDLLRQSSESLAGRIAYHSLGGFSLGEVGEERMRRLWSRGGFPRSFLARGDADSFHWRESFLRTFLERDLPQLGIAIPSVTLRRFWSMLAHYHARIWNGSELARSFGVADTTVRRYLDTLVGALVVKALPPWHENLGKRQVKSPKIYIADTGVLHSLLGIEGEDDLLRHPKLGASWESFAIGEIATRIGARPEECFFWSTYSGAELDLLVVRGQRRRGFEIKYTDAPRTNASMRSAMTDLRLDSLEVIHAGEHSFPMAEGVRAVALSRIATDLEPLA